MKKYEHLWPMAIGNAFSNKPFAAAVKLWENATPEQKEKIKRNPKVMSEHRKLVYEAMGKPKLFDWD